MRRQALPLANFTVSGVYFGHIEVAATAAHRMETPRCPQKNPGITAGAKLPPPSATAAEVRGSSDTAIVTILQCQNA